VIMAWPVVTVQCRDPSLRSGTRRMKAKSRLFKHSHLSLSLTNQPRPDDGVWLEQLISSPEEFALKAIITDV
jgi:hypothetical protein